MIDVKVTKEKGNRNLMPSDHYSMSVSINKTLAVRREVNDCLGMREIPQDYVIEQMVGDIVNSFRDEVRLQVSRAMSRPVKQIWSN